MSLKQDKRVEVLHHTLMPYEMVVTIPDRETKMTACVTMMTGNETWMIVRRNHFAIHPIDGPIWMTLSSTEMAAGNVMSLAIMSADVIIRDQWCAIDVTDEDTKKNTTDSSVDNFLAKIQRPPSGTMTL